MLRYDQRAKAGQGLGFAFPPSSLRPLPVGLATPSAAGCPAHGRFSAPGSLPGTTGQRGSPALALAVQISLLGVSWTTGNTATTRCLPCRPWKTWTPCWRRWCSTLLPPDSARSCSVSSRSGMCKEWASQGLFLTLREGGVPTPVPCRDSVLQGGCPPPLGSRGLPTRLSRSTVAAERVASAFLPGHKVGPGDLSQACKPASAPGAGTPLQALLEIRASLNGLCEPSPGVQQCCFCWSR